MTVREAIKLLSEHPQDNEFLCRDKHGDLRPCVGFVQISTRPVYRLFQTYTTASQRYWKIAA